MAFLSTMNIIASGMTAQHTRLDVISENVTNMNTTRTEAGGPYRRKIVVMQSESNKDGFRMAMQKAASGMVSAYGYHEDDSRYDFGDSSDRRSRRIASIRRDLSNRGHEVAGGVRIAEIAEDDSVFPIVYDPTHPDANEEGYVEMPNVTLVKEVTDAMAASQAYNADVTAFTVLKSVISKGLEISE